MNKHVEDSRFFFALIIIEDVEIVVEDVPK